jgi:hypothetical protein
VSLILRDGTTPLGKMTLGIMTFSITVKVAFGITVKLSEPSAITLLTGVIYEYL